MPLYKTMKKATFSDSEDEVCLRIYMFTLQFLLKLSCCCFLLEWMADIDYTTSH